MNQVRIRFQNYLFKADKIISHPLANRREGGRTQTRGPARGSAHVCTAAAAMETATVAATTTTVAAWQHQRREPGGQREGGLANANQG
jgi:hypothetical protein